MSAARTGWVAGVGCRKDAPLADVLAAIDAALALHRLTRDSLDALATVALKRHEPAIAGAAETLGVPLVVVSDAAARGVADRCLTHSAASMTATGISCVSEASALAATGADGRLVHPRAVHGAAACAVTSLAPPVGEPRP